MATLFMHSPSQYFIVTKEKQQYFKCGEFDTLERLVVASVNSMPTMTEIYGFQYMKGSNSRRNAFKQTLGLRATLGFCNHVVIISYRPLVRRHNLFA